MLGLYPPLAGFGAKSAPVADVRTLVQMGVPEDLIHPLFKARREYQARMNRMQLRIFYALIPRWKGWIKDGWGGTGYNDYGALQSQAYAFVRRVDQLEQLLKVKRPRAPALKRQLDAWKAR